MAKVFFHHLSMNFQKVREYFPDGQPARALGFILQPEQPDPNNRKDEYILVGYPLLLNNTFDPEFSLTEQNQSEEIKNKLTLGNIYFGGQKLQRFLDSDIITPITSLYFTPVRRGKYVGYKVKAIPERNFAEILLEEDLNPSPPATPGFS